MTSSRIFLYLCLSFAGGVFINSAIGVPWLVLPGILILGIFLISVFWKYKKIAVAGFCVLFLAIGIWRQGQAQAEIKESALQNHNDSEGSVVFTGIIAEEPDIREKIQRLTIKDIHFANGGSIGGGRILATLWRYPGYQYGDKLKITGKLKTPEVFEGFNYREYLQKEGIYSVMDFPKTELIGKDFGSPLMKYIFSFKNKFKETARTFISPPEEGILEALIFGDEGNISKEWKDKLNLTGTRHIAAVSGMNITIISSLILSFVLGLGFWRNQAFYFSAFLIFIYILMIGAPASAVRAGVMASILIAAQGFGRLSSGARAVVFAAVLMLFFNPLLLRFDVGFQLSFLAILGLIYFQPSFLNWLKKVPNPKIFPVRTTLSATLAAQTFTLPILIFNFGYISLVSPFTNILIVPLLAPITVLILVFGFVGMIFSPLAFALSLPTRLLLVYIVSVIDFFSKIPLATLRLEHIYFIKNILTFGGVGPGIHWVWMAIIYLVLGYFARRITQKNKYVNFCLNPPFFDKNR